MRYDYLSVVSSDCSNSSDSTIIALRSLAMKALEYEHAIRKVYSFHIGEGEIEVFRSEDTHNYEYLTYEGIWKMRHSGAYLNVTCDAKHLYDFMKADYLYNNGILEATDSTGISQEERVSVYGYLKRFLEDTMRKYNNLK